VSRVIGCIEWRSWRRSRCWSRHTSCRGTPSIVPAYLLPWNPIYPSLLALALGALGAVACRPDLKRNTLIGGVLFLALYSAFMFGLRWLAPGYIAAVWNLPALSGGLVYGIPLEELLFGLTFGMYWSGVYEHLTWHRSVTATHSRAAVT